jgi:FkbM family methyltransferase
MSTRAGAAARVNLYRQLIRLLDRKGGRTILGKLATWYVQGRWNLDAAIFYEGVWIHRFGDTYYVDEPQFNYLTQFPHWPDVAKTLKQETYDYWFHAFAPAPGMVILDVGAGLGTDTLFFSRAVGPTGKVIAIEPHPRTFAMLQATCRLNRLDNVTPVNCAAMDKACGVYIEDQKKHDENTVSLERGPQHLPTQVRGVALDDLCGELGVARIDFIKMNIEGAERFAIGGMKAVVRRARYVCIACHDWRSEQGAEFCTRVAVTDFLRENGFEITTRDDDPRRPVRDHILGIRPSAQHLDRVGSLSSNAG